jgi:uncharacterized tellurite resistance protein B-like protein
MGPLEIRKVDFRAGEDGDGPKGIGLEVRGLIPVNRPLNLGFITSVIDVTNDDDSEPVLSALDSFQESDSPAYQHVQDGMSISPDQGFTDWVQVGSVFPELLIPAFGGTRKLMIITRLVDIGNMPSINLGFGPTAPAEHSGLIAFRSVHYEFHYQGKGFKDAAEHRDEARALAVRLGMAVAIADGSLDDSEGNVIKGWVTKTIEPFGGSKKEELKALYNDAMRNAFADAKAGELSLSQVTTRLNEIAEEPQKYEAIELCFDVMAADGVADEAELDSIRRIAEALELDVKEMETLRDKKLIELDVGLGHQATPEAIIGIQGDWSPDQIKTHIRKEFAKWNDRLNNLPEGQERENAQRMLDMLSEARKKYA